MNCVNCKHHKVVSDRDPHDWFNDDDEAIVCMLVKNDKQKPDSIYLSERNEQKVISSALRPYETHKVKQPEWCPLLKKS
jgi:hypothetical protein